MDHPLSNENKSFVVSSFNINYLKEGGHVILQPIPGDLLYHIGFVAVHWGTFEIELNNFIRVMLRAMGREVAGWDRLSFVKRKKLFVDLIKETFAEDFPEVAKSYQSIAGSAADLHWRRNLVVHGQYRVTFPPAGADKPNFWAEGKHNGREVCISIDQATLEKLWHDIAHLGGALRATAATHGATTEGWPYSLPNTEILRIHRESIHPGNPNPDKQLPPPPPSRG